MVNFNWACVPENFNLEEHLACYPPELPSFKVWKLTYILDLVTKIPARNKDVWIKDGYVPLKARYLQAKVADYKKYLSYLIETGVLCCDGHYIEGKKSLGYRYADKFFNAELAAIQIPQIPKLRMTKDEREKAAILAFMRDTKPYLFHWYDQNKLEVDKLAAMDYAMKVRDEKVLNEELWDVEDGKKKHPQQQYSSIQHNIEMLANKAYNVCFDDVGYRQHSCLTNLKSYYRNFLSYDGQTLCAIDIKNCQPYLINLVAKQEFWRADTDFNITTLLSPHITVYDDATHTLTIQYTIDNISSEEVELYAAKTGDGAIYEYIIAEAAKTGHSLNRDEAKIMFLTLMYAPNHSSKNRWLKQLFSGLFPSLNELFTLIKEKDYKQLAYIMQNIESELILGKICSRIWEEGKQSIPVFTIHDSIVTTEPNVELVRSIIEDEMQKYIGVKPATETEIWRIA